MTSLAKLAKENMVTNKDVKAKKAAKIQRIKDIQRNRTIATKMDKELTKLEQIADKEEAKQAKALAKEEAKQAKLEAKQSAKEEAKQAKEEAKEETKQAKALAKEEAKEEAKQAKLEAKRQAKTQEQQQYSRQDIIQTICEKLGHGGGGIFL